MVFHVAPSAYVSCYCDGQLEGWRKPIELVQVMYCKLSDNLQTTTSYPTGAQAKIHTLISEVRGE